MAEHWGPQYEHIEKKNSQMTFIATDDASKRDFLQHTKTQNDLKMK
jgi:hypothetical protein